MSDTATTYNHKINNNDYTFRVTLVSVAGNQSTGQDISPTNIKELFIGESLNQFYSEGYIIIDNNQDVIERDTPNISPYTTPAYYNNAGSTNETATNQNAGFVFRGEARDILKIDIMPKLDTQTVDGLGSSDGQKYFYINYDFAIHNSEEIPGDKPGEKLKKLYFRDLFYQLMLEKNVPFTTATVADALANSTPLTELSLVPTASAITLPQNADNSDRAISTGLALKEFIKAAFPPDDNYPASFAITIPGVDDITTLTPAEQDQQNIDWDLGGTNIFFSTPANFKAIDCVKYIMSRHVSDANSNFDQCFLQLTRDSRQFKLKSLIQYFREAYNATNDSPGNLYLETVKIGGNTQQDGQDNTLPYFTPSSGLHFDRIGTIKSFSFDNMAGVISQLKLVPTFVHSYDYQNKQFQIDIARNGIAQAMKTYQQNYVNYMNSSNEEQAFPNFAPGQLRHQNKNVSNVFSTTNQDADQRLAWGRNEFLYASVFTNNLMSFRLIGSTHRQPGNFIGIDRDGAIPSSKFDNKLLGIYLILEVRHSFQGNKYYNDLHCIKVYNFKQLDDTYTKEQADGNLIGLVSNGQ